MIQSVLVSSSFDCFSLGQGAAHSILTGIISRLVARRHHLWCCFNRHTQRAPTPTSPLQASCSQTFRSDSHTPQNTFTPFNFQHSFCKRRHRICFSIHRPFTHLVCLLALAAISVVQPGQASKRSSHTHPRRAHSLPHLWPPSPTTILGTAVQHHTAFQALHFIILSLLPVTLPRPSSSLTSCR